MVAGYLLCEMCSCQDSPPASPWSGPESPWYIPGRHRLPCLGAVHAFSQFDEMIEKEIMTTDWIMRRCFQPEGVGVKDG